MGIEQYKLTALFGHFYIEKWINFTFFYSQTFVNHISLVFHYFEQFKQKKLKEDATETKKQKTIKKFRAI